MLIWKLINSAVFQSALTLTWRLHPSPSATIAASSAAKSFSRETGRPAEAAGLGWALGPCSLAARALGFEQHVLGPAVRSLQPFIRWMFDISAAEKTWDSYRRTEERAVVSRLQEGAADGPAEAGMVSWGVGGGGHLHNKPSP